jgi:hypothetical protein
MKLIAVHNKEGKIFTLHTVPFNSPMAEIKTTEGRHKTELEISEMQLDFSHPDIHHHLNKIMEEYVVEHHPSHGSSGRLVRRQSY